MPITRLGLPLARVAGTADRWTADLTAAAATNSAPHDRHEAHARVRADRGTIDVAKPELGAKRQCQNCGTKFFDLNRDPIVCPKCGTVFQALPPPARQPRAAPAPSRDEDEVEAEAGAELVSLEDAEAGEKAELVADDDIEIEDDAGPTTPSSKRRRKRTTTSPA